MNTFMHRYIYTKYYTYIRKRFLFGKKYFRSISKIDPLFSHLVLSYLPLVSVGNIEFIEQLFFLINAIAEMAKHFHVALKIWHAQIYMWKSFIEHIKTIRGDEMAQAIG